MMASSNVAIASASTTNSELPRQSSICSLSSMIADLQHHHHQQSDEASRSLGPVTMDDLLKNIYSEQPQQQQQQQPAPPPPEPPYSATVVDDVWQNIVEGGDGGHHPLTLEAFLESKNGDVREDDVRVPVGYGQFQMPSQGVEAPMLVYGNGSGAVARGKRRAVEEPLDKATQQKQRRMIKNRESAARSRERKQAYTVELESLVTQLEEENARLLREEAERKKERLKQLMENLVPVVEKKISPRVLRRVNSLPW